MEEYRRIRERRARISTATGIVLTLACHAALGCFGVFHGLKYVWPPPEERSFVIDFSQEPEHLTQGERPSAEDADPQKPDELVQKSEAPLEGSKANEAPESAVDDFSDVEAVQPQREEIDRRALFPSAANDIDKDTMAAQTASKVSEALKAGHAAGNTKSGRTNGAPNAQVKGRNTVGVIPKPSYTGQESGTVVVRVWVNQFGAVEKAVPGDEGTTTQDATLWLAARKAAMDTKFNMDAEAPALQEGTITYIFSLR